MSHTKYRIPSMAMAVMVLGAHGCGDDEGLRNETPSNPRNPGPIKAFDGGSSAMRDGGSSSSDSRDGGVRSSRDGGSTGGSTGSRFDDVGEQSCKVILSCGTAPGDPPPYSSQQECVDDYQSEFKADFDASTPKCRDAFLSYYECYVETGCDADFDACEQLYQAFYQACDNEPLLTGS